MTQPVTSTPASRGLVGLLLLAGLAGFGLQWVYESTAPRVAANRSQHALQMVVDEGR